MKKPFLLPLLLLCPFLADAQPTTQEWEVGAGKWCQLSFYSDHVLRLQFRESGEQHLPDSHYEMVVSHAKKGAFRQVGQLPAPAFRSENSGLRVQAQEGGLALMQGAQKLFAIERFVSNDSLKKIVARYDPSEHFCGLGHPSYALVESLDLAGKAVSSNYGEGKVKDWGAQGVLTVPFFISSKGYGIFLNSTFAHRFNFGQGGAFSLQLDTKGYEGRMDLFFIHGPSPGAILDRYTQLTGRPVMLPKSVFGLQLSDKGFPENDGMDWWVEKVEAHREAGYPLDHITHDNRWRAGSGGWSGSWFEWDSTRYPDPRAFEQWANEEGLTMTLDLNRNIIADCDGYQARFNLPQSEKYLEHGRSAPDFTNPAARGWLWRLFWEQSFDPELGYPGDGLWIDETDDLWPLPDSLVLHNGWRWAEAANYHNFLIAKAIVQEGWLSGNERSLRRRPFVWQRALTAGAQRWSTHWSGDLKCSYSWMEGNIRGMLASGLSGFPYFNHDAGGFRGGPDDEMYIQWAMAMGSFSPIWRPHGFGLRKRWPLDRNLRCQKAALKYSHLRYRWMPYLYTQAWKAHRAGLPIARAMMIDYPEEEAAWQYDLQYLWGGDMIVAPTHSDWNTTQQIWLPPGSDWVDFWTEAVYPGGQVITYEAQIEELPLFIKRGAVIPGREYAQSTAFMEDGHLILDIYTGADGQFELYEDDGVSLAYQEGRYRTTVLKYEEQSSACTIQAAEGTYEGSPGRRSYELHFHLLEQPPRRVLLNGQALPEAQLRWEKGILKVRVEEQPVEKTLLVRLD